MKTANVSIFVGVIVCGLVATRAPLHAQVVDAPNIAGSDDMPWNKGVNAQTRTAARETFLEGNRLFKIPLFSQAVEKYTEALEKWKHPAFYFNLAIAQINLSQYLEARENLEEALKYGPDPLREDRFQEAKKQLVEVEHHLGRIRVRCPTPGARDRRWSTSRRHAAPSARDTQLRIPVPLRGRSRASRPCRESRPWARR